MKQRRNFSRIKFVSGLYLCVFLTACDTTPIIPALPNIVEEEKDSGPERPVSVGHIGEPVPMVEPRTRAGNSSPYKVLGKTYHVTQQPEGYKVQGVASWYGRKFHGRRTANGEIYDMYAMTAAHKTLPIPSYVRVTNLANKRTVIVRINDRGPFHGDRIIDLSYTAAKKLGFENIGTAKVVVEYIDPHTWKNPAQPQSRQASNASTGEPPAPTPSHAGGHKLPDNTWLQVGAFGKRDAAQSLKGKIANLTKYPVVVVEPKAGTADKLFRVRVGPIKDNFDLLELRRILQEQRLPEPHLVYN